MTDYDRINAIGDYVINQYPTGFMQIILDLVIPFVGYSCPFCDMCNKKLRLFLKQISL